MKNKIKYIQIIILQAVVCLYTLSSVAAKKASNYSLQDSGFWGWILVEYAILGFYAIIWQQIIKRMELSIAYTNRAVAIFWSMLWAFLLFKEQITFQNLLGIALIFIGTWVVNSSD